MSVVAPAILAENVDQYKQQIEMVQGFATRLHVDLCDGEFAPTFTITESEMVWPTGTEIDVHAMVARPIEHVQALVALKPSLIIFHVEVAEDLTPTIQYVRQAGIKVGLALLRSTVPAAVAQLISLADHVMVFSGELGHYGGTASLMQLEKVRLIRAIKPDVEVGWDGGVAIENAFSLSQGTVDVLNVGSTIMKNSDPAGTYATLVDEINKHSVI